MPLIGQRSFPNIITADSEKDRPREGDLGSSPLHSSNCVLEMKFRGPVIAAIARQGVPLRESGSWK